MASKKNSTQTVLSTADVADLTAALAGQTLSTSAPEEAKVETMSITLPKTAKETAQYIIVKACPEVGGRERWFEKKRMTSISKDDAGLITLTMPAKAFADRKMA